MLSNIVSLHILVDATSTDKSTIRLNTTGSERDNVKQKPLLEVLFESETTMNSLLFLKNSPRTLEEILTFLNIAEKELLLHIVELENYYIIAKNSDNMYGLTTIGKLLVNNMEPLLNVLSEIESMAIFFLGGAVSSRNPNITSIRYS
jgi:hypothetical protein